MEIQEIQVVEREIPGIQEVPAAREIQAVVAAQEVPAVPEVQAVVEALEVPAVPVAQEAGEAQAVPVVRPVQRLHRELQLLHHSRELPRRHHNRV